MTPEHMPRIAEFIHRCIELATTFQQQAPSKLLKDFEKVLDDTDSPISTALRDLRREVQTFARQFPLPGIPDTSALTAFDDE